MNPSLEFEYRLWHDGHHWIAGLDEVGRGAWAGPVVAAAVILPVDRADLPLVLHQVRDSKTLTSRMREVQCSLIRSTAMAVGVGMASPHYIDIHGIVPATQRAMEMAVHNLGLRPQHLLIDALRLPAMSVPQHSLIEGDALVLSIAAASIVAKVARDHWMVALDRYYSGYDFARNKGYGTPDHRSALIALGPCPAHRMSFAPLCALWPGDASSGH